MASHVLVCGDVMLDVYLHCHVTRISPEAPVPIATLSTTESRLGGAGNVAAGVRALGAQAYLFGVVGGDRSGFELETLARDLGISTHLTRVHHAKTTVKTRVLARGHQMLRIDDDYSGDPGAVCTGANSFFDAAVMESSVVVLSDYGKGALVNVQDMIRTARLYRKPVLVDPKGSDFSRYTGCTVLKPNEDEMRAVVGAWDSEAQLEERVHALRAQHRIDYILLTRGEHGVSLYNDTGVAHYEGHAREVYDVSGAGDTVIATLAVAISSGESIYRAVFAANRAAGIVVGKSGTSTVSLEDIVEF